MIYRLCYDRFIEAYEPQLEEEWSKTLEIGDDGNEKVLVTIRILGEVEYGDFYRQYVRLVLAWHETRASVVLVSANPAQVEFTLLIAGYILLRTDIISRY